MIGRIYLLMWAGLVFLSAIRAYPAAAEQSTSESQALLNAYQGIVDEHLQGVLSGLKGLAATQEVASGNWQRMRGPLTEFGKSVPTEAATPPLEARVKSALRCL